MLEQPSSTTLFTNTSSPTPRTSTWASFKPRHRKLNLQPSISALSQFSSRYYQPNPSAPTPFTVVSSLNDPDFASSCSGQSGNCANAWGLRVISSSNVLIYGAGLYSFFDNYSTSMSSFTHSPHTFFFLSALLSFVQKISFTDILLKLAPTAAVPKTAKTISSVLKARFPMSTFIA